ncbi:hypothetical protein V2J09_008308 [Rumex salicifolius]
MDTTKGDVAPSSNPGEVQTPSEAEKQPQTWKSIVSSEEDDRVVLAKDFLVGKITIWQPSEETTDPIVTISNDVLEALATTWKNSIVIKALGTKIPYEIMQRKLRELWKPKSRMRVIDLPNGYYLIKFKEEADYMGVLIGGPWTIFGHYVIIKPWSPNFNPLTDVISTSPAWIRLHDLPVILYEESILLQLASAIGKPIKVDQQTLHTNRGRFARICIELDLSRPLKGAIIINGSRFLVEYEGLHTICFGCGRFGHFQPSCPHDPKNIARKVESQAAKEQDEAVGAPSEKERPWGTWMTRPHRRRMNHRKDKSERPTVTNSDTSHAAKTGNKALGVGRYNALAVDENKESNRMAGESSKVVKGQQASGAKEVTGRKLEKEKQKVEEEKRMKEGMSNRKEGSEEVIEVGQGTEVAAASKSKKNKLRKQARKNAISKVAIGPNNDANQGPIKRSRAVYEPAPFAKPTLVPNSFNTCKMGERDGPSELGASTHLQLGCNGPQIILPSSPSSSNQDINILESKLDAEMLIDEENKMEAAASIVSVGAGKAGFVKNVNYTIRSRNVSILALFETQISGERADAVCARIQLNNYFRIEAQGRTGGIWVFWDADRILSSQQHFVRSRITLNSRNFQFVFAYAPPTVYRRRPFWADFEAELNDVSEPLFVGGDFNCIIDSSERQGGSGYLHNDSAVFLNLINTVGLIDMGFCGQNFTWSRGNKVENHVAKRLDRVLLNSDARLQCPEAFVRHLPKFGSDHTPLLVSFESPENRYQRRRPFRFEAAWLSHPDFHSFLDQNWPKNCAATAALAQLKPKLLRWNKQVFGNIQERKKQILADIEDVQTRVGVHVTDDLLNQNARLQSDLDRVINQEELLWQQKSRELWLQGGDRNTSFFHASTIIRRRKNKIETLQNSQETFIKCRLKSFSL